jgi:predicted phosphoribosyltransferase
MSKMISVKKGTINTATVVVSYLVSIASVWLAKKTGVPLSEELQLALVISLTSILSGAITGLLNWIKHLPKKVQEEVIPE